MQNPNANPRPTAQDLAGFWDLLQLSIEDISMKFDELYHLKANSWQLAETPERKVSVGQFRAVRALHRYFRYDIYSCLQTEDL